MPLRVTIRPSSTQAGVERERGKFPRLKVVVMAVLILSAAIGVFIAAFTLGLIIAMVLLIVIVVALLVGFVSHVWRAFWRGGQEEPGEHR